MSYARAIIERFGGLTKMSEALSVQGRHYPKSTIQYWGDCGFIPAQEQTWVLKRGQTLAPPLEHKDFFETALRRRRVGSR